MIKSMTIHLPNGDNLKWDFDFSQQGTMRLTNTFVTDIPDWIRLSYYQCPACTLAEGGDATCPVADVLAGYAHALADRRSYERVRVDVYQDDGPCMTLQSVPLQTVVSELVRLAVFQYECPVGRKVKTAMTNLPPFPSNEEILYAFARSFDAAPYEDDEPTEGQLRFFESLHELFGHLSARLENVGQGDAQLNGIVILHSLAVLFTLSAPELIRSLSISADPSPVA